MGHGQKRFWAFHYLNRLYTNELKRSVTLRVVPSLVQFEINAYKYRISVHGIDDSMLYPFIFQSTIQCQLQNPVETRITLLITCEVKLKKLVKYELLKRQFQQLVSSFHSITNNMCWTVGVSSYTIGWQNSTKNCYAAYITKKSKEWTF